MKYGHVEGTKQASRSSQAWYDHVAEQHIAAALAQDDAERALVTALAIQVGNAVSAMPEAAERIRKAAALVQQRQCWPLSDGTFLVGSQTDAERAYLVRRGPWTCECAHATHRSSLCAHQLAAMLTIKVGTAYQPSYN